MVDSKLIWLDFERKLVSHVDLDSLETGKHKDVADDDGKVMWHLASCPGFTVREVLSSYSYDEYRSHGVQINEINHLSVLRKKKIEEACDKDLCLM